MTNNEKFNALLNATPYNLQIADMLLQLFSMHSKQELEIIFQIKGESK